MTGHLSQFNRATPLFLDSLSTFTATELLPYDKLVLYAIVTGTLTLGRVEMKKKVRDRIKLYFGSVFRRSSSIFRLFATPGQLRELFVDLAICFRMRLPDHPSVLTPLARPLRSSSLRK